MAIQSPYFPTKELASSQDFVLFENGVWSVCKPLSFSEISGKQKRLKLTASAIDALAKKSLKEAVDAQKGIVGLELFPPSSAIDALVDRWMHRFNFSAKRLKYTDFTHENIEAFFESLRRQFDNIVGQWDHQFPKDLDEKTRKLLDAVFYFGEALFLKDNVPIWGAKLLEIQTTISRWPAHFSACQKLEFSPREVRSLEWLATVCAYILSDFLRVEKNVEFDIFIASLGQSITYRVAERFDLVGELWAFGLVPKGAQKAPPVILIRGTQKNPFKEGFWGSWWLNANPDFPGASICTSQSRLPGHRKLIRWMRHQHQRTSQKSLLVGHSIGGAIAIGLSISEHQVVEKAVVFNAPIYREMATPYLQLAHPPEILQFQNCRDPISQLQTTDLGHIYHLDSSQNENAKNITVDYFDSIASTLPDNINAKPSIWSKRLMQIANCAYRILKGLFNTRWMRICLSVEPLATLGDFARKLLYFPNSIHRYHSVPSSLQDKCLVLKCTPSDLNRTELITLRLVFQWMCRTWGFLAISAALSLRKVCNIIAPRVCADAKILKNSLFRTS